MTAEDILGQVRALPTTERVHEVGLPAKVEPPLAEMTDDEFAEFQVPFENAQPGSKGFKRAPTSRDLEWLK